MKRETVAATAADPTIEFTPLLVNGKTYRLAFTFDGMARAEEESGMSLLLGLGNNFLRPTMKQARGLLYGSLVAAHPEITLEEVTRMLTPQNAPRIMHALIETWTASRPENPPQPEAEPALQQKTGS